jgi:hypothetical protein
VHLAAAAQQRHRDNGRAGGDLLAGSRAVVRHLAAELVTEHNALVGAHEAVVAELRHDVRRLVAVMARVEVRSAYPAAQHLDQHLPSAGLGVGQVDHLEFGLVAGHGLHI